MSKNKHVSDMENKESQVQLDEEKPKTTQNEPNYLEMAQRIQAEFENYKKRNATVSQDSFKSGVMTAVKKLLPAIDSFKQAKAQIQDESVLSGLDLILSQLLNALKELGVTKIECVGQKFDPKFHNAVLVGKDEDKPDEVVLEEYQEGFIMGENVIRHSVVKINKLS